MTRGTTFNMTFSFDEIDIAQIKYAEITLNQNGVNVLIKKLKRYEKIYTVNFTEEETLQLKEGFCDVQAKVKLKDGNVIATDIERIPVNRLLHDEVML